MYELPARRWRRCLWAPVMTTMSFGLFFTAAVLIGAGIVSQTRTAVLAGIGGGVYVVGFEALVYRMSLKVDASGLVVTNLLVRHRIPWDDVTGFEVATTYWRDAYKVVVVDRGRGYSRRVGVFASVGMSRGARGQAARDLAAELSARQ